MEIKQIQKYEEIEEVLWKMGDTFQDLGKRVDIQKYIKKISEHANIYIMKQNDIICGMAAIYMNDLKEKTAYMTLIGIAEQFRREHLGTELFAYCLLKAKCAGMRKIKLEVDKNNEGAISFYKKKGLYIIGENSIGNYYMEKVII